MNFSLDEFIKIRDFVFERTGLFFEDKKLFFIKKRLSSRMGAIDVSTPIEYLRFLKFCDPNHTEFLRFISLITTNETYFFREFEQLACFAEKCIDEVIANKQGSLKQLKIGCFACSTGEEAYTLSIILNEMLDNGWAYKIDASDIDHTVLAHAKSGIYSDRSIKEVPSEYYSKYFTLISKGHRVSQTIRKSVSFRFLNMMDKESMRSLNNYDFIFCRNVLIYFNDASRRMVVDYLFNALNPGGFIFLGHSESIGRITTKFRLRRFENDLVYQKPLKNAYEVN